MGFQVRCNGSSKRSSKHHRRVGAVHCLLEHELRTCFEASLYRVIFNQELVVVLGFQVAQSLASDHIRTTLSEGTSLMQGLFLERLLTAELVFAIFILAKEKYRAT